MPLNPNDPIVKKADKKGLQQAKFEDQRHRLHAEAATSAASASPYWKKFVDEFIKKTVVAPATQEQLLRQIVFPLVSVEVVDEIIDASSAVHYAQDRSITIRMSDEKLQASAEQYLEEIDLANFIARNCHNALFSAPNSLVIVDAPAEQTTPFPEPYIYLVASDKVESAESLDSLRGPADAGLLNFAFFKTDKDKQFALFDGENIGIYTRGVNGEWAEVFKPVAHNLPFNPAWKMWADVEDNNPLVSNSMIRPQLGSFDRYVFWDGAKETNDLSAAFQTFWHFKGKDCEYITEDKFKCQKGIIERPNPNPGPGALPIRSACPIRDQCAARQVGGIGGRLPIPVPTTKDGFDMREPAGWIKAAVDNLKYVEEKVEKLKAKLIKSATGYEAGPSNKQALNEDQIMAILEKSRQVGQYLAQHFQTLHKRAIDAILGMRYGSSYLGCNVNYGRRFNLLTGDQLMVLYASAKEGGLTWLMEEIEAMLQDYYARADPNRLLRYRLIADLNPYPFMATSDLIEADIHITDQPGFMLSIALLRWVRQFEWEENVPIERFGITMDYAKRVPEISKSLRQYVKDANFKPIATSDATGNESGGNTESKSGGKSGSSSGRTDSGRKSGNRTGGSSAKRKSADA
jgi:hypothetical protein